MKQFRLLTGVAGILCAFLFTAGCGGDGDSSPTLVEKSTPITADKAAVQTDGTVKTTATVTAEAPVVTGLTASTVTVPADTVIEGKDASGATVKFTTLPAIVISYPPGTTAQQSGVSLIPVDSASSDLVAVVSVEGAVDVKVSGVVSSTFSKPISITVPMPGKADGYIVDEVYKVKSDGVYIPVAGGPFTVSNGSITVQLSDLCWLLVKPKFMKKDGSSGSKGGTPFS